MKFTNEAAKTSIDCTGRAIVEVIGSNVGYLRSVHEISRKSLVMGLRAKGINISFWGLTLFEWQKDKSSFTFSYVLALAYYFNVPVNRLMFEDLRLAPDFQDKKPKVKRVNKKRVKKVK